MPKTNFTSKLLDMKEFNFKDIKITDTQIYISVEIKTENKLNILLWI